MDSSPQTVDQSAPLLGDLPRREHAALMRTARRLYVSHFLSTWNSRVFEFGSVLYLATIYPGTLLPMSAYAMARSLSAILFAPAVGRHIDRGSRLRVVRVSIGLSSPSQASSTRSSLLTHLFKVFQRLAVAASCAIFYALTVRKPSGRGGDAGMLALLSAFACLEKLGSIMNLVSVEKDWVHQHC